MLQPSTRSSRLIDDVRRWIPQSVLVSFIAIGAGSLIGFPVTSQPPVQVPPPHGRPDVILITVDALRADHLSLYGYRKLTSPVLDEFAGHAAVFTNAITQAPYTKAAIASLMSGLYPTSHQAVTTTIPFPETMTGHLTTRPMATDVLAPSITTLAEAFHGEGYKTFGYTANPFLLASFGFDQGFDHYQFFPGGDFAQATQVTDQALADIRQAGGRPIFLWLHLMEPHSPYAPPPLTRDMFPPQGNAELIPGDRPPPSWLLQGSPPDLRAYVGRYDEEIAAADVAVRELIRNLAELRPLRSPIVVITSDHGEEFLDHGGWEHGRTLHDELIRVPLVVAAPGAEGRRIDSQVQLIDLYPTLLELAGVALPTTVAGVSFVDRLHGRGEPEPAFSELPNSAYAVRWNGWKCIVFADRHTELYDLRTDPQEQHNVASAEASRASTMVRLVDRHLADAIKRGETIEQRTVPIDSNTLEQLRSLGYVQR
jgi:arylsulfatase A-like enzyme